MDNMTIYVENLMEPPKELLELISSKKYIIPRDESDFKNVKAIIGNYKSLLREIKEDLVNGETYLVSDLEDSISLRYQFFLNQIYINSL